MVFCSFSSLDCFTHSLSFPWFSQELSLRSPLNQTVRADMILAKARIPGGVDRAQVQQTCPDDSWGVDTQSAESIRKYDID